MILLASTWLGLSLVLCLFAWFAARWLALALPFAVALAALAIYLPTGTPRFTSPPPGDYRVLGAKIVPNVAIWVLLDDSKGSIEPRYFRLPYTTAQANALQQASDTAGEGGVKAKVGGDGGGVEFDGEEPVRGDETKTPEAPAITLP